MAGRVNDSAEPSVCTHDAIRVNHTEIRCETSFFAEWPATATTEKRKEKQGDETVSHTEANRPDPVGRDFGAGPLRRGGCGSHGEHRRVRRVGVGPPPQCP